MEPQSSKKSSIDPSIEFQIEMDSESPVKQSVVSEASGGESRKVSRPPLPRLSMRPQTSFRQQVTYKELSCENIDDLPQEEEAPDVGKARQSLLDDFDYGNNKYGSLEILLTPQQIKLIEKNSRRITELQSLLKRECLLLEYEEKHKKDTIKEIEVSYVNGYSRYLQLRNLKSTYRGFSTSSVLLTKKDIMQVHEGFQSDLEIIKNELYDIIYPKDSQGTGSKITEVFLINEKPSETFLVDINNFVPNWHQNIEAFMRLEFDKADRIESVFESEYTLPSKVISAVKFRESVQQFCEVIFERPLSGLKAIKGELSVDFAVIYEKWSQNLFNIPNSNPLKQFLEGRYLIEEGAVKKSIIQEINKFFDESISSKEYEKMLIELNHFAKNKNALNFLIEEVGPEEIQASINLRLAMLVWKKIQINRRKLEQLSCSFIDQIIDNYDRIPSEIKFIMKRFRSMAMQKFGESVKFEDIKSFFNKIIFSQLFFSTFMSMYEQNDFELNAKKEVSHHNFNITMIALISQKVMFGQQFYEKFKYGYFNSTIKKYAAKIRTFIEGFAQTETIVFPQKREVECMLLSVESIKFIYSILRKHNRIKELSSIECRVLPYAKSDFFPLGSSKYTQDKMYVLLVCKPSFNYSSIFQPKDKFKRVFIDFLLLIETISQGVTFRQVLEQYKFTEEDHQEGSKPSIQIHANYLEVFSKDIETEKIVCEIEQTIQNTKKLIERVKINLQREQNYAKNLENLYVSELKGKKKVLSKQTLKDYVNCLIMLPLTFDYQVIEGKICEVEEIQKQRVFKDCLNDICEFFVQKYEGLDALYSILIQKILEEVKNQGVADEFMSESVQSIIGQKLNQMLNLSEVSADKDKKLYESMKKHSFLNLKLLSLSEYSDEEELILELCLPIIERLRTQILSPDRMLECLYEMTIVFQNVITCVGKASDVTSDVQIPLMELVLIKSGIKNLSTLLEFIKTFCLMDTGSSKYGLVLALVESICYLIENMDEKHLNMSEEEYMGHLEKDYIIIE